ncbi:BglG family transcription antiterminator LicT [Clostridium estertheticum]|uniref:BglG family transcription antiterminator LicT n=1 Tax=Clostridium estertheticum TaxID=238834 RepID=UPI001CF5BA50|nr:PRD domain-containing protein [Clostridium estertheticum]MCB2353336.1 PRD domain-containing protein [Clostridium estertheticum]WAG41685.1 PRD domain-containing protein [Clostridium estertheticum]
MKIKKVLNNNAVTVMNNDNREIVVMGLGLAFKKRAGDELEEDRIERVFTLENKEVSERLKNLISEIPAKYVEISEEIIKYAEANLEKKLNENIYLTLTDHISFAMTRHKQGLNIKNPMLWDIKRFYKQEYAIGLTALKIIKENFEVTLLEDEAASIALHIVNAELNQDMPKVVAMTKVIQEILNIIRYNFKMDFDEESLSYHRLVTHLKFFAQRMMNETTAKSDDEYLYDIVIEKYSDVYKCVNKIKTHLKKAYNTTLSKEEMVYLTIHIQRVVNRDTIK